MATKNLIIVESPAKSKTIEKFLGPDFKVVSTFGHIRDLRKRNFGVDLGSFSPEYEIPADKRHIVSELRTAAKGAATVWLASDDDREGEAIAWHLAEVLKLDPKEARRIVFHEITPTAIREAIAAPRTIDLNLVNAQQARRVLDRLVGFRLSPVLWKKVRLGLSAGRVQSVAVKLIVEREREIQRFQQVASYRISAEFTLPDGQKLPCHLSRTFATEDEAREFLAACRTASFHVAEVQREPARRSPAAPFTTSTLQQEAGRRLNFPVALTMRLAQSLYENGLITYMRTDSMNLSTLCLDATAKAIRESMGEAYLKRRTYQTHSKGAQEAHEAIHPTYMERRTIEGTPQEQRLYQLIWRRTMACQMADAQIERTTVTISMDGREEQFSTTGEEVLFDGFLKLYGDTRADDTADDAAPYSLPASPKGENFCSPGTAVQASAIVAQQRYSLAPPRYNEMALVHKLDELGIGRPSTYAPIISTIQQREYVQRGDKPGEERPHRMLTLKPDGRIDVEVVSKVIGAEKSKLSPTDVGVVVTDFLEQCFPTIMDYNFTANVERDFDTVAEGKKEWTGLIREFYGGFNSAVEDAMQVRSERRVGERLLGTDPLSGEPVSAKIGRFGPLVQIGSTTDGQSKPRFASLKSDQRIETITLEEALELFKLPRQLGTINGTPVRVASGRYGPYVQHGGRCVSLGKDDNPLEIDIMRAASLLKAASEAEKASHLKQFAEDPDMEVRSGRFGPYLSYKGKNYKLPKAQAQRAAELTLEECMAIIKEAPKPTSRSRGGGAKS